MLAFLNNSYPSDPDLKNNLKIISGISLGMFLFILFFEPFEPAHFNFNNQLLIIAGYGVITLITLGIILLLLPWIFPGFLSIENRTLIKEIILNFSIWAVNSVAYVFFTRYVAQVVITFYLVFIIVLLSIAPVVILRLYNVTWFLRQQLRQYQDEENKPDRTTPGEINNNHAEIELASENRSEIIRLIPAKIMAVKAADNYIEVFFKENDEIQKSLLRNTLKNIQEQLKNYPGIVRCHRTYIVNIRYVLKLTKNYKGFWLKLSGFDYELPVSRQYILFVREALNIS